MTYHPHYLPPDSEPWWQQQDLDERWIEEQLMNDRTKFDDNTPLGEMVPSKSNYLAKEDAGEAGINLTIKGFTRETVGEGSDADVRTVCYWVEDAKPMVINKTNMNRISTITGANTAGEAKGHKVNVYNDKFVEYGGKMIGGLRIREATEEVDTDDIPF